MYWLLCNRLFTAYLSKTGARTHLLLLLLTRILRLGSSRQIWLSDSFKLMKHCCHNYDRCHILKSRIDIHFVTMYFCQVNCYGRGWWVPSGFDKVLRGSKRSPVLSSLTSNLMKNRLLIKILSILSKPCVLEEDDAKPLNFRTISTFLTGNFTYTVRHPHKSCKLWLLLFLFINFMRVVALKNMLFQCSCSIRPCFGWSEYHLEEKHLLVCFRTNLSALWNLYDYMQSKIRSY